MASKLEKVIGYISLSWGSMQHLNESIGTSDGMA